VRAFDNAVAERVTWGYTNTCASWASDTAHRVTGERVNASELLGMTGTPRQIRESIEQLERHRATAPDRPQQPADIERDRSTSSGSFAAVEAGGDGALERLLASTQDPQAVQRALRDLAVSGQGRAFIEQGQARLADLGSREPQQQEPGPPAIGRA
jgi:hypothetical protein